MRNRFIAAAAAVLFAACFSPPASAQGKLQIVASFSILGDMARQVAGDHANIVTLVGRDADAHAFEPTPHDAKTLAAADLVIVNGLGFEGWMQRLVKASGYKGAIVVASQGIAPLTVRDEEDGDEDEGDDEKDGDMQDDHAHRHHHSQDPHAWQDVSNAIVYVNNMRDALVRRDPPNAQDYTKNAAAYAESLGKLDREIKQSMAAIDAGRRKVVTTHDAFGYFARAYGVEFLAPVGVSTESEASAADMARIVDALKRHHVRALFLENTSDPRMVEQLAKEGGHIGGKLYPDALSAPDGPARTYLDMMRYNARVLAEGMQHNS